MYKPIEKRLRHLHDFTVRYRFYSKDEGGRAYPPYQGYRSDFWYDAAGPGQLFMIWPEFEDTAGEVIIENDHTVPETGTARMWIIIPERRPMHYDNIRMGLKGYFMEGARRVAECEVIEIVGLKDNPVLSGSH
ncbi:MAG TPA: hypothetical protein VM802_05240 [Chitinophaga sp.]|uniref:hypothetical protein n=1 Tax=Chitinophaga sp. TaxID=1869181 RepID=UPI002BC5A1BC|nr:hypothetical protein [Chitinophaga sp.]HVI44247.1 hypothetical protein [Chitinophaga sp.]